MARQREIDRDGLEGRIASLPGFEAARAAATASELDAYLVGGAVRDALLGHERADLDLVVVGDHLALARALGDEIRGARPVRDRDRRHDHGAVDVARARAETYQYPGALPEVRPAGLDAGPLQARLQHQRDGGRAHGAMGADRPAQGAGGSQGGRLRTLHERSLADDLDAGAARRALRRPPRPRPRGGNAGQIRAADLGTVSAERIEAERRKSAAECDLARGFELLDRWGLIAMSAGAAS